MEHISLGLELQMKYVTLFGGNVDATMVLLVASRSVRW